MKQECECTNGIFYFTTPHRVEDSQPCGKCNKEYYENKAFDQADGIASTAFVEICGLFERLGLNSESQADWARTVMEKWS